MVRLSSLLYASMLLAVSSAAPLSKRISQIISDSTTKWVAACVCFLGLVLLSANVDDSIFSKRLVEEVSVKRYLRTPS